jgi:hypothetical membrane protein
MDGRGPALVGILGPLIFWGVLITLGQTQPTYDATRSDISLLALGANGWIQTVSFAVFGLSIVGFQAGLQRAVTGKVVGPIAVLAVMCGGGLIAIAIFPTDLPGVWTVHGSVHLGVVAILAALLPVSGFVTAGKMTEHSSWRRYALPTRLTAGLTGALAVLLLVVWGGAWAGAHRWLGLFERAVFLVPSLWMEITALHLLTRSKVH